MDGGGRGGRVSIFFFFFFATRHGNSPNHNFENYKTL